MAEKKKDGDGQDPNSGLHAGANRQSGVGDDDGKKKKGSVLFQGEPGQLLLEEEAESLRPDGPTNEELVESTRDAIEDALELEEGAEEPSLADELIDMGVGVSGSEEPEGDDEGRSEDWRDGDAESWDDLIDAAREERKGKEGPSKEGEEEGEPATGTAEPATQVEVTVEGELDDPVNEADSDNNSDDVSNEELPPLPDKQIEFNEKGIPFVRYLMGSLSPDVGFIVEDNKVLILEKDVEGTRKPSSEEKTIIARIIANEIGNSHEVSFSWRGKLKFKKRKGEKTKDEVPPYPKHHQGNIDFKTGRIKEFSGRIIDPEGGEKVFSYKITNGRVEIFRGVATSKGSPAWQEPTREEMGEVMEDVRSKLNGANEASGSGNENRFRCEISEDGAISLVDTLVLRSAAGRKKKAKESDPSPETDEESPEVESTADAGYPEIEGIDFEEGTINVSGEVEIAEERYLYVVKNNIPRIQKPSDGEGSEGRLELPTPGEAAAIAEDLEDLIREETGTERFRCVFNNESMKIRIIDTSDAGADAGRAKKKGVWENFGKKTADVFGGVAAEVRGIQIEPEEITEDTFKETLKIKEVALPGKKTIRILNVAGMFENGDKFIVRNNKVHVYDDAEGRAKEPTTKDMEAITRMLNEELQSEALKAVYEEGSATIKIEEKPEEEKKGRKVRKNLKEKAIDLGLGFGKGVLKWGTSPVWAPYKAAKWSIGKKNTLHRDVAKAVALVGAWTVGRLGLRLAVKGSIGALKSASGVVKETLKTIFWKGPAKTAKGLGMSVGATKALWKMKKPQQGFLSKSLFGLKATGAAIATPFAFLGGGIYGLGKGLKDGIKGAENDGGAVGVWKAAEPFTKGFSDAFQFGLLKGAFKKDPNQDGWIASLVPDVLRGKGKIKPEDLSHLWLALDKAKVLDKYKEIKKKNPGIGFWGAFSKAAEGVKSADVGKIAFAVKDVLNAEGAMGSIIPGYFVVKSALAGDEPDAPEYKGALLKTVGSMDADGFRGFIDGFDLGDMFEANPIILMDETEIRKVVAGGRRTQGARLKTARAIKGIFGFEAKSYPRIDAFASRVRKVREKITALREEINTKSAAGEDMEALSANLDDFEAAVDTAAAILGDAELFGQLMAPPQVGRSAA